MQIRLIFIVILLSMTTGCAAWKQGLKSHGDINTAIENCVVDFVHTSKLSREGGVYIVKIKKYNNKTYRISIGVAQQAVSLSLQDTVGSMSGYLPTRYILQDRRVFLWEDAGTPITQKLLDLMANCGLIVDSAIYMLDGAWMSDVYYVCKDDFRVFRKTKEDVWGGKRYRVPKMKCTKEGPDFLFDWPMYVHGDVPVLLPSRHFTPSHLFQTHRLLVPCAGIKDTLDVSVVFHVAYPEIQFSTPVDTMPQIRLVSLQYKKPTAFKKNVLTQEDAPTYHGQQKVIWDACVQIVHYWGVHQPYDEYDKKYQGGFGLSSEFYLVPERKL